MNDYKVYVLLQRYDDFFGKACRWIGKGFYNHASIGFDEAMNEFYSFRSKWGFCIEHPFNFEKSHRRTINCAIYEVAVTEDVYNEVKDRIRQFFDEREKYRYSYLSASLGYLRIKHYLPNRYYCSRFVAEILKKSGAIALRKHVSLYWPSDFMDEMPCARYIGRIGAFEKNTVFNNLETMNR